MERREVEEDLRKVKLQKLLFLFGGLGLFALAIALFINFMVRREVPGLILACVALIFGALLLNQSMRTREIEDMISEKLESIPGTEGPPGFTGRTGDGEADEPAGDRDRGDEEGEGQEGVDGQGGGQGGGGDGGDSVGGGDGE